MFTSIILKNYRSLVDFKANLEKLGRPQKLIIVYGENGVGKTNFTSAFLTLLQIMNSLNMKKNIDFAINKADAISNELPEEIKKQIINEILNKNYTDMESIIDNNKTIGTKDNMIMEFNFIIDGKKGQYIIETNSKTIIRERLRYVLNKNIVNIFEISKGDKDQYIEKRFNSDAFKNIDYVNVMKNYVDQYWGKHSFMSILRYEASDKNIEFIKNNWNENLINVLFSLISMSCKIKNTDFESNTFSTRKNILGNISEGIISLEQEKDLSLLSDLLDDLFTKLYSDIKQVYYKKKIVEEKIYYKLVFKKMIYDSLLDIEYDKESTGTIKILDLVPFIISSLEKCVTIIDEIDTGIHDLLINNILENLHYADLEQLIITTHNTMLLESKELSDSIYILTVEKDGSKLMIPLSDFRVSNTVNHRKQYLKGNYGGIPFSSNVDFDDLYKLYIDYEEE